MDEKWSLNAWIAHSEALDRQREIALQAALQSAKEAVTKAEVAADKRFELLNELRSGVATKAQLDALEKQIITLASRMDLNQGSDTGVYAATRNRLATLSVVLIGIGVVLPGLTALITYLVVHK